MRNLFNRIRAWLLWWSREVCDEHSEPYLWEYGERWTK